MEKVYSYVLDDVRCDECSDVYRTTLSNFLPAKEKYFGNTGFQSEFIKYVIDDCKQNLVVSKARQCGVTLTIFRVAMALASSGRRVAIVMNSSYKTRELLDKIMYCRNNGEDLEECRDVKYSLIASKLTNLNKIEDCCLMKFGESGELMIIKDTSESINCIRGKDIELDYIFYDEFAFFNMDNFKDIHMMLKALNPFMRCIYASTRNSGDNESMEVFNNLISSEESRVLYTNYTDMIRKDKVKVLYEMARALPYDEFIVQCFGGFERAKE